MATELTEGRTRALPDDVLKNNVQVFIDCGGNKSEAARRLGIPRITLHDRLKVAEARFGISLGRIADGQVEPLQHVVRPLPKRGAVNRYILTSVQNNTHLHPGWFNLKAYADFLNELPNSSCEFIVGTFSYALDAYGKKAVKRGTWKPDGADMWYAPEIRDYIMDTRVELAPGLIWCGEMNILPTATNPLTGLETYNGRASNIVPHVQIAMESVPALRGEGTKFNYSTGTITQRNYIQKRAGIVAEQRHCYGGLLVEVDHTGAWWCRQLHIDGNGHVYDVGPSDEGITEAGDVIRIMDGRVTYTGKVDSIVWGDIHASEMEPWVRALGWGAGGMLDSLLPIRQFFHDVYSMRSRSHHEMKSFHKMFEKHVKGLANVEQEVEVTAKFITEANRDWCQTIVVPSNHDRHLERWLDEEDPRKDPINAQYHIRLQARYLEAVARHEKGFNILEWALREKGIPEDVLFLEEDESYVICRDAYEGGIECSLHGDRGPNGARGSTRNLTKLGRAVIKGHDHTAAIRHNVYSVGACSLDFSYMAGPTAHSVTHCVVFENGRRQLVTMWNGKWRA